MQNRKKSQKNMLYSILGQVITISLGIILPRLYIITYGSEVNGMLSSIQQFLVYLNLFEAGVGAVTLQALYGPIARHDYDSINGVLSATNAFYRRTAKFYGIGLLLLGLLYPLSIKTTLPYSFMIACVILSGFGNFVLYLVHAKYRLLLQADGKYYISVNLSTAMTIITSFSKIILVSLGKDVVSVLTVSAVVQLIPAVFLMIYVRRNYPFLDLTVPPQYEKISQRNYMLIHQIAGMVFQNTDLLFITTMCGLKEASVYAVYRMIISHLESILAIPINSIGFILGQTYQIDKEVYIKRIDLFERWYSAAVFATYVVTLQLLMPFVSIYSRGVTDIQYADNTLAILFVVAAVFTAMRVPMLNTIHYAGKFKDTLPQTMLETLINLIVTTVGIIFLGIYGALIGTIVALFYRTNDVIIYSNRKLLNRSPMRTYFIYFEQITISLVLSVLFHSFRQPHTYGQFVVIGMAMFLISCISFTLINMLISRESREFVRTQMMKKKK